MEPPEDKRKHPRWLVEQVVRLDILGNQPRTTLVKIVEASRSGLRICGVGEVAAGTAVAIRMGQDLLLGEVIWCASGVAGVALEQLLDLKQAERLRRLE